MPQFGEGLRIRALSKGALFVLSAGVARQTNDEIETVLTANIGRWLGLLLPDFRQLLCDARAWRAALHPIATESRADRLLPTAD